jgi:hypothetical protein
MASKAAECDPIGDARAGMGLKAVTLQKKRVLGTLRKTHMLRLQEGIPPEIFKHLNRALQAKTRRYELRSGGARILDIVTKDLQRQAEYYSKEETRLQGGEDAKFKEQAKALASEPDLGKRRDAIVKMMSNGAYANKIDSVKQGDCLNGQTLSDPAEVKAELPKIFRAQDDDNLDGGAHIPAVKGWLSTFVPRFPDNTGGGGE